MPERQFKSVEPNPDFNRLENGILAFWEKEKIFEKSVRSRPKTKEFTFYDGPPFATGLPHYGHIVPGTVKDIIPRYWAMKGYRVERRFGWDCHGLPIEYQLEKELKISSKKEILKMGIDKFNEKCRGIVLRYVKEWEEIIPRLGRWVDFKKDYKTMDPAYMESIWWVFKQLWEKGLIYEGYKSLHVCPRCGTPLSNFEVTLGYKDKKDDSVVVKFPLKNEKNTFVLAWTTTPWTLPGNVLLAVNPKLEYVRASWEGSNYILAQKRVKAVFGDQKVKLRKVSLKTIVGQNYEPLFPLADPKKSYRVAKASFVSSEEGTGIVHIAPAFGEDDYLLGQKQKADFVQHINPDGLVNEKLPQYLGIYFLKLNKKVIDELDQKKLLFSVAQITHSYPFCWRCETALMNYATKTWFAEVIKIKDKLLKNNKKIYWIPKNVKFGRFGKWLDGVRDWAISRNRFWGTPIPVWRCDKTGEVQVIGSIKELEEKTGKKVTDLHLHKIKDLAWINQKTKGVMRLSGEVLDCWFESGSMPYAFNHYPFDNKTWFEDHFPADFIAESIDQTRGWFYTLHVLGSALFDRPAFKNVVTNGVVLAEDGQKMSKSKKNFPDPMLIVQKYGADALRFYLMSSQVIKGEDLCFSEKGVLLVTRSIFLKLWNVYRFFISFAILNNWHPLETDTSKLSVIDRWILARLDKIVFQVTESMEKYDISRALYVLPVFVDDLSVWYLRRSRDRMNPLNEDKADRESAFATLHSCLTIFSRILAPFCPFISESIFKNLTGQESVHLSDWPKLPKKFQVDKKLLDQMEFVRQVCELGHAERKRLGIKVRQPLKKLKAQSSKLKADKEYLQLINEELNVKEVEIIQGKGKLKVTLDTKITSELKAEGEARDIIRMIQQERKKAGLKTSDLIKVVLPYWPTDFEKDILSKTISKKLEIGEKLQIKLVSK